jgi:hypothetical protein
MIELGLYKHYKGNYYHVINIGTHSETLEKHVIYQSLYGDYGFWVRPLSLFSEKVEIKGNSVPRFTFIRPISAGTAFAT